MSEASEAKRDGAKLQKNSGRGKHLKGDAVLRGHFLIDYKEASKSFGINEKVWAKVSTDAVKQGLIPLIKIILGTEDKVRLWVVPDYIMTDLLDAWEQVNG
jgi:hypothetical protein